MTFSPRVLTAQREPEFPQLVVILHAGCLYIGHQTLVTVKMGNGIIGDRDHLSPCWLHRGGSHRVEDVVAIANGAETSAPSLWARCDGLALVAGIEATMMVTENGVRALRNMTDSPFWGWIDFEAARLAEVKGLLEP